VYYLIDKNISHVNDFAKIDKKTDFYITFAKKLRNLLLGNDEN